MDDAALLQVLKALAHPKRFRMVQEIAAAGEVSCGDLGARCNVAQPTVSHHLKILADAGVLTIRREGQHGYISVNRAVIDRAGALLPDSLIGPVGRSKRVSRRGR